MVEPNENFIRLVDTVVKKDGTKQPSLYFLNKYKSLIEWMNNQEIPLVNQKEIMEKHIKEEEHLDTFQLNYENYRRYVKKLKGAQSSKKKVAEKKDTVSQNGTSVQPNGTTTQTQSPSNEGEAKGSGRSKKGFFKNSFEDLAKKIE